MNARGLDVASSDGWLKPLAILTDKKETDPFTFIAMRASISYAYPSQVPYLDKWAWFKEYWPAFETIGRIAYHVLYPGEDGPGQLRNHLAVVPAGQPHVKRCIDAELDHGQTKKVITDKCEYLVKGMQDADGFSPLVYGRALWVNEFMEYRPWFNEVDWFLAQYLNDRTIEDTRQPALPIGVTKWLIHQNADHYPSNGLTEALELDIDRFNGDSAAVRKYFGFAEENPLEQRVTQLEELAASLADRVFELERKVAIDNQGITTLTDTAKQIGELLRRL